MLEKCATAPPDKVPEFRMENLLKNQLFLYAALTSSLLGAWLSDAYEHRLVVTLLDFLVLY